MTIENSQYGSDWVKCCLCTVHNHLRTLALDLTSETWRCTDESRCKAWRDELAKKHEATR